MKELYQVAGITKQAMWKYRNRQQQVNKTTTEVIRQMEQIRQQHRRMSCRRMYYVAGKAALVGRDKFEQIGFANGFKLKPVRNVIRTTWSVRTATYPNLIEGRKLNDINQVWQSDIFYLRIGPDHYYGFTIEDVYSRELLALHLSKSLGAEQLTIAFRKALSMRKGYSVRGCIFHSDRGTQYISRVHKQLIKDHQMKISMAKLPQQNAYVERLQGILKQEYLWEDELTAGNVDRVLRKIIRRYNLSRPHSSLNMFTPEAVKNQIKKLRPSKRPCLIIHKGFEKSTGKNNRTHLEKTIWKSGKNARLFSKEIFSTFPHRNTINDKLKKTKIKQKNT